MHIVVLNTHTHEHRIHMKVCEVEENVKKMRGFCLEPFYKNL